jgi:hypothetical protein
MIADGAFGVGDAVRVAEQFSHARSLAGLGRSFTLKNSICAIPVCSYVGSMNWQQFLTLLIVLGVATFFVWRSSGTKKHKHSHHCGCAHGCDAEKQKEKATR